jgi:hypothetical protein
LITISAIFSPKPKQKTEWLSSAGLYSGVRSA